MFYIIHLKKIKRAAVFLLAIFFILLCFRFVILPNYLFPQKYSYYVEKYGKQYGVETALIYAVIKTESGFQPDAISGKNARGLMQLSESTGFWGAAENGIVLTSPEALFDPETNIQIGCWYLARLLNQYDQNVSVALAAYNAGSGNVSKWLKDEQYSQDGTTLYYIPFGETGRYVKKVLLRKKIYEILYEETR